MSKHPFASPLEEFSRATYRKHSEARLLCCVNIANSLNPRRAFICCSRIPQDWQTPSMFYTSDCWSRWEWVKIPLLSIGMGWTFIYHLFLGSLSTRLLTHSQVSWCCFESAQAKNLHWCGFSPIAETTKWRHWPLGGSLTHGTGSKMSTEQIPHRSAQLQQIFQGSCSVSQLVFVGF